MLKKTQCITQSFTYCTSARLQLSGLNCYYEGEVLGLHHSCLTFVQVYFALHIKVIAFCSNRNLSKSLPFAASNQKTENSNGARIFFATFCRGRFQLCACARISCTVLTSRWPVFRVHGPPLLGLSLCCSEDTPISFPRHTVSGMEKETVKFQVWNTLSPMKNLQGSARDVGNTFSYHSESPIQP